MPELVKNLICTVRCEGYTSEGAGVARVDGRVVFVKGLIEGEVCRARILKVGKNVAYAKIEELLERSPHRVSPDCQVYGRCGGCTLRHMDYTEELRFKLNKVNDCLRRLGGTDVTAESIIPSPLTDGYRNKTIYTVSRIGDRAVTGFYRPRSHDLVPLERCAAESDYASRASGAVREWMERWDIPEFDCRRGEGVRRVFCRFGFATREGQVTLVTGKGELPRRDELIRTVLHSCPETVGILRSVNDSAGDTVLGRDFELLWGRERIWDELAGLRFSIAPGAFYQVNRDGAERLYAMAIELAGLDGTQRVLDLFCGTGTITLLMARRAREAVGVEIVESAVMSAGENARRNGIENVRFISGDAGSETEKLHGEGFRPDVVVVDPPRKGLLTGATEIIARMEPERIVYVSCDPATLARDIKDFSVRGYCPERVCAVDMFPRTCHVETVVLMSKIDKSIICEKGK